ncbi:hypothetical protein KEJ26_00335 [Candidatus Bathyarchaeota archaeon]|nr:hypothetical protein [Candidatus Bathyarchaeota archaeon]
MSTRKQGKAKPLESIKLKPSSIVYWTRIGLAVLTTLICLGLQLSGVRGIILGVLMYIVSYYVIRFGLNVEPEAVGGGNKLFTIGIGSYFLVWLFTWALLYTLLR